ncbi:MAG: hypothetical protein JWQ87_4893 [Candidatus Sulfotelmatobacter sp.]|nr:hypothetical protein [Candidatus Sulfotelmatobacter sp.]
MQYSGVYCGSREAQNLESMFGQPERKILDDCPAALARLKAEDDSSGWLRRVSPVVGVERPDTEVSIFVNIAPVFGA